MNPLKRLARRAAELPSSAFTEWERGILFALTTSEHELWDLLDAKMTEFDGLLKNALDTREKIRKIAG